LGRVPIEDLDNLGDKLMEVEKTSLAVAAIGLVLPTV